MSLKLLEQGGICRILVFLLRYPEGVVRSKYREKPLNLNPRAADRDHIALFKEGLIESINHPKKLVFALSEKGKEVALKLKEIEDVLKA